MSVHSVARGRAYSFVLLTVLGLWTLAAAPAAMAQGAAAPAPTAGPTVGDTKVTGSVPTPVFTDVAAGFSTGYALDSDGVIWAWGSNWYGQVGNGSTSTGAVAPVQVLADASGNPLPKFAAVSSAYQVGLGLDVEGNIWAWGYNGSGLVGDGTYVNRWAPVELTVGVQGALQVQLPKFVSVVGGVYTAYGLDADGHIWAWGANMNGQIGNGSTAGDGTISPVTGQNVQQTHPVEIMPGQTFTSIAAGAAGIFALDSNGSIWTWGYCASYNLGTGTTCSVPSSRPTPVQLTTSAAGQPLPPFQAVATGYYGGYALDGAGNIWSWGPGSYGQVGNGSTNTQTRPVQLSVVDAQGAAVSFQALAGGNFTGYALDSVGNVWSWGYDGYGNLGNGTQIDQTVPGELKLDVTGGPLPKFQAIASQNMTAYGLDADGRLWGWGANDAGQVGNGSTANQLAPTPVATLTVTSVTFDGVPGTGLTWNQDGTWSVDTPPGCGQADVVVSYSWGGVAQTPLTYPDGFTYGSAPSFTSVTSSTSGGTFTGSVVVTGDDTPTIQWQSSSDGVTWTNLAGQTSATLTVPNAGAGTKYRVQATNCWASLSSDVLAADPPIHPSPSPQTSNPVSPAPASAALPQSTSGSVAHTGASLATSGLDAWLAVACLASGAALLAMIWLRRRGEVLPSAG